MNAPQISTGSLALHDVYLHGLRMSVFTRFSHHGVLSHINSEQKHFGKILDYWLRPIHLMSWFHMFAPTWAIALWIHLIGNNRLCTFGLVIVVRIAFGMLFKSIRTSNIGHTKTGKFPQWFRVFSVCVGWFPFSHFWLWFTCWHQKIVDTFVIA